MPPTPVSRKPKPSGSPGQVPEMLAKSAQLRIAGQPRVDHADRADAVLAEGQREGAPVAAGLGVVADEAAALRRFHVELEPHPERRLERQREVGRTQVPVAGRREAGRDAQPDALHRGGERSQLDGERHAQAELQLLADQQVASTQWTVATPPTLRSIGTRNVKPGARPAQPEPPAPRPGEAEIEARGQLDVGQRGRDERVAVAGRHDERHAGQRPLDRNVGDVHELDADADGRHAELEPGAPVGAQDDRSHRRVPESGACRQRAAARARHRLRAGEDGVRSRRDAEVERPGATSCGQRRKSHRTELEAWAAAPERALVGWTQDLHVRGELRPDRRSPGQRQPQPDRQRPAGRVALVLGEVVQPSPGRPDCHATAELRHEPAGARAEQERQRLCVAGVAEPRVADGGLERSDGIGEEPG